MHLGTWYWDSNVCKWCCSMIYKTGAKEAFGIHSSPPWFSLSSTQSKGEWDEHLLNATPTSADYTAGWNGFREGGSLWTTSCRGKWNQHRQQIHGPRDISSNRKVGQIWPFDFWGSPLLEECRLARSRLNHVFAVLLFWKNIRQIFMPVWSGLPVRASFLPCCHSLTLWDEQPVEWRNIPRQREAL